MLWYPFSGSGLMILGFRRWWQRPIISTFGLPGWRYCICVLTQQRLIWRILKSQLFSPCQLQSWVKLSSILNAAAEWALHESWFSIVCLFVVSKTSTFSSPLLSLNGAKGRISISLITCRQRKTVLVLRTFPFKCFSVTASHQDSLKPTELHFVG